MPTILLSDFLRAKADALGEVMDRNTDNRSYLSELYKYASRLKNRAAHLSLAGEQKPDRLPPHLFTGDTLVCSECGNTKAFGCSRACSLQTSRRLRRATRRIK